MKNKSNYVDGFVLVIQKNKLDAYKKMATIGSKVWKKHGALDYRECIIDDPKPMYVTFTFAKMLGLKKNEIAVFSYIEFKSRTHRDQVNAKVMKDPMMNNPKYKDMPMPFDMKRMAYGGFKTIVSA
jgi:uncharacterized protein YbaA (DUF1428 family)